MEIEKKIVDGSLVIKLKGKIDANNAPDFEREVMDDVFKASCVKIDCSELEYISSAGLRVILKIKKTVKDTSIVDATPESYDIFQMTGFTEMMKISKKLREISVEGCEVIGHGYYGTIYRLSKDTIVKVYGRGLELERIENERELARKAFVLGVPTAIPMDIVKVGNEYGSIFELLDAETLCERIIKDLGNIDKYVKQSVDVLKIIHAAELKPGELVDKKAEVLGWAKEIHGMLPKDVGNRVVSLVKGIKEDNHMLHGDYHIKNVMMIGEEPFIIDMDTLAQGSPIFELGFMYSSYVGYQEIDHDNGMQFFGIEHDYLVHFFNKSVELYCNGYTNDQIQLVIKKCRILCYIQLIDRFDKYKDHPELLERFKKQIAELVYEVNDLNL